MKIKDLIEFLSTQDQEIEVGIDQNNYLSKKLKIEYKYIDENEHYEKYLYDYSERNSDQKVLILKWY